MAPSENEFDTPVLSFPAQAFEHKFLTGESKTPPEGGAGIPSHCSSSNPWSTGEHPHVASSSVANQLLIKRPPEVLGSRPARTLQHSYPDANPNLGFAIYISSDAGHSMLAHTPQIMSSVSPRLRSHPRP